jgi:tetratricopeptide (TPR) repeat protein
VTIIRPLADTENSGEIVTRAKLNRQLGKFQEALQELNQCEASNPQFVFEKFRVFEEMGDLGNALEELEKFAASAMTDLEGNNPETFLVQLAAAYVACFVRGEWKKAMNLALSAYEKYLRGRTSYSMTFVSIFAWEVPSKVSRKLKYIGSN